MIERRTELVAAGVSAAAALVLALVLPPAPLLTEYAGQGWARVLEFLFITALLFALLSIPGVIKGSVEIGPSGLTATRGRDDVNPDATRATVDAALAKGLAEVESANRDLAEKVARLEGIVEVFVASGTTAAGIDPRRIDVPSQASSRLPRPADQVEP